MAYENFVPTTSDCLSTLVQSTILDNNPWPSVKVEANSENKQMLHFFNKHNLQQNPSTFPGSTQFTQSPPTELPEIAVHFVKQPPENVRKINFFTFSLALFEVEKSSSQQQQPQLKPITVLDAQFGGFIEGDDTKNGIFYHLLLKLPSNTQTFVTLTLQMVDASSKRIITYEGTDRNADLQRVLLTHNVLCLRCSSGKSCGNAKETPSTPLLISNGSSSSSTTLQFFLRCNQNCYRQSPSLDYTFSGSGGCSGRPSNSRLRKFQLAVSLEIKSENGSFTSIFYSNSLHVHNSSRFKTPAGAGATLLSSEINLSLPVENFSSTATPEIKKKAIKKKPKSLQSQMELLNKVADKLAPLSSPPSQTLSQTPSQKPSITTLSPLKGPPGTELLLLGHNFDSSKSNLEVLFDGHFSLKPTILSPNALKVIVPSFLELQNSQSKDSEQKLIPGYLLITLVDRSTGFFTDCPTPFNLLEEVATPEQQQKQLELQLARLHQMLPAKSAFLSTSSFSSSFSSEESNSGSSEEVLDRAALYLEWYYKNQEMEIKANLQKSSFAAPNYPNSFVQQSFQADINLNSNQTPLPPINSSFSSAMNFSNSYDQSFTQQNPPNYLHPSYNYPQGVAEYLPTYSGSFYNTAEYSYQPYNQQQ